MRLCLTCIIHHNDSFLVSVANLEQSCGPMTLMENGINNVIHYAHDFFFYSTIHQVIIRRLTISLCTQLRFPVALSNVAGHNPVLNFLGIEIDCQMRTLTASAKVDMV